MGKSSQMVTVAGNPVVQSIVAGAVAASTGSPLAAVGAAIFQTLFSSAAGTAVAEEIKSQLEKLEAELSGLKVEVAVMQSGQLLVAHQAVREMCASIDPKRLELLRRIVVGAIKDQELDENNAYVIARILRDVTPAEVGFLTRYFQYSRLFLTGPTFGEDGCSPDAAAPLRSDGAVGLVGTVAEVQMVEGLVRAGLMKRSDSWAEAYEFTGVVAKLLAYLGK